MLPDIHHKYLGVTPITFEDIEFSKFAFFLSPHSTLFCQKDRTSFVPCQDFAFLAMGPGRYKSKQKSKLLSTKIELQALNEPGPDDQVEEA